LQQLQRQGQRLLVAYLAEVIGLDELERTRHDLDQQRERLSVQQRQLDAVARQQITLSQVADSIEAFCAQVRTGLEQATFEQRRALVELLIDRGIVTDGEVGIRYVIPTSPHGPLRRFCQLRLDYLDGPAVPIQLPQVIG
jgi:site-specific DNA recombinase